MLGAFDCILTGSSQQTCIWASSKNNGLEFSFSLFRVHINNSGGWCIDFCQSHAIFIKISFISETILKLYSLTHQFSFVILTTDFKLSNLRNGISFTDYKTAVVMHTFSCHNTFVCRMTNGRAYKRQSSTIKFREICYQMTFAACLCIKDKNSTEHCDIVIRKFLSSFYFGLNTRK